MTTADELYKKSLKGQYSKDTPLRVLESGLSNRVYNTLARNDFTQQHKDGRWGIDWAKLHDAVLDGSIWLYRGVGEKAVREICEALAKRETL